MNGLFLVRQYFCSHYENFIVKVACLKVCSELIFLIKGIFFNFISEKKRKIAVRFYLKLWYAKSFYGEKNITE